LHNRPNHKRLGWDQWVLRRLREALHLLNADGRAGPLRGLCYLLLQLLLHFLHNRPNHKRLGWDQWVLRLLREAPHLNADGCAGPLRSLLSADGRAGPLRGLGLFSSDHKGRKALPDEASLLQLEIHNPVWGGVLPGACRAADWPR